MALTDAQEPSGRRGLPRLPPRLQAWLASEHGLAQRIAGTAFAIRVAGAAAVFLSQVLLARWLGSFEFGLYIYAWTWLLLVGDIIHLGLPLTAQRYIPEYARHEQWDRLRGFLVGSRWLVFAISTAIAILGGCTVHVLQRHVDSGLILPLYLACVALPFYTLSNMLDGVARTYDAIAVALLPQFVLRPLVLILLMAAAHAAGVTLDASAAMAAFAAACWTTTALQLVALERRIRRAAPRGPRRYEFRTWLATSLPIVTAGAFFTLLSYADVLVLQLFRPADEVAHYFAAAKTLSLVAFIYYSVSAAVAHRFANYHVAADRDGLAALARSSVRWTFWPSLAATAAILALGEPILRLFGPNFGAAYPLMFVLALGLLARAAIGPAERLLNMLDQQRLCALIYACAFAINIAAAFLLAPRFGGLGVATATVAAIFVETGLLYLAVRRRLGVRLFVWQPSVRT